jgi:hypothetical protein
MRLLRRILIKIGLKYDGVFRSVFIRLNIVTLVSFREHGNEISGFKKGGHFIDYVDHY